MAAPNPVILLIGFHGSGKSTFTKAVTGADVEIGRSGEVNESKCSGLRVSTIVHLHRLG